MRALSSVNTVGKASIAVLLLLMSLTALGASAEVHPAGADATGNAIVSAAALQSGKLYCEGGGGINGPSSGTGCTPPTVGYDCMSLAQFAVYHVTGITVPIDGEMLPGPGSQDWDGQGTYIASSGGEPALQPGDVVFFGGSDMWHYAHSGIYTGDPSGDVWDALQAGTPVGEHSMSELTSLYGDYDGAVRYTGSVTPPAFGVSTTSLPAATIGTAYSGQLTAVGGTAPYSWKVQGLPRGLKANKSTGTIAGTVKISKRSPPAGPYAFVVTVSDHSKPKKTTTADLTITLDPAP